MLDPVALSLKTTHVPVNKRRKHKVRHVQMAYLEDTQSLGNSHVLVVPTIQEAGVRGRKIQMMGSLKTVHASRQQTFPTEIVIMA